MNKNSLNKEVNNNMTVELENNNNKVSKGDNMNNNDNEFFKQIEELRLMGFSKKQILTILSIVEINNDFCFQYGSIIFHILDNMEIKEVKNVKEKVETLLIQNEISVFTNITLDYLVFDIEC